HRKWPAARFRRGRRPATPPPRRVATRRGRRGLSARGPSLSSGEPWRLSVTVRPEGAHWYPSRGTTFGGGIPVEIDIGIGKSGRQAFGFDDIAIVPSRRTRDPDDVDISWQQDALRYQLPTMGAPLDAATSPATAVEIGKLGGLGVLNLEGLWPRYEDPNPYYEEIAELEPDKATRRMQEIYLEPIKPELIGRRVEQMKAEGIVTAASLTPQRVKELSPYALEAGLDILVIQGTVVSAEHVSSKGEPLNLKEFIAECEVPVIVGGCASYSTALHLMRTGAVGVLVGVGPGAACTTRGVLGVGVPQATAIADAAGARM